MPRFVAAGAACAVLAALIPATASAALRPARCSALYDPPGATCATLTVPLDRTGATPGTTKLFVERLRARRASKSAIVFFPGGPGESTTLLARFELQSVSRALADHDALLFDQRGTGRSDYLDCDVALTPTYYVPAGAQPQQLAKTIERCAHTLGAKRALYTTRETVDDLEAVRKAADIDKLVLVGVSYGTRDAMAYARTYPEHVDKLVLDSLVADPGLDPFALDSVHAIPRVLEHLCRGSGCDGVTTDPVGDLRTLVARIAQGPPLRAKQPVTVLGCRERPAITRGRLYELFAAADLDPQLLAQLPVAVARAAHGDPFQLSELVAGLEGQFLYGCAFAKLIKKIRTHGLAISRADRKLADKVFSPGDWAATVCEETQLPWDRATPPSERRRAAEATLATLPDSAFAPFDRATVLYESAATFCKYWVAAPAWPALPTGPLPPVPTLIMTGLDDLRTPGEDALALAMQTPTAQLLTVPDIGHAVLPNSGCARRGFLRFVAGQPISACHVYPVHRPAPARRVKSPVEQVIEAIGKFRLSQRATNVAWAGR